MQIFGRRYDTAQPVSIEIHEGKIHQIAARQDACPPPDDWPWISPGWLDIQTNGYGGQEFSSPDLTAEKVAHITQAYLGYGVTQYCPTLTTESFEVLKHSLETIDQACQGLPDIGRRIAGIHLEGPYVSSQDGARGAHPLSHCRRPDWDEFRRLQDAAGGRIRIHTLSAEFDEAPAFIRKLADSGVVVAIGHTSATSEQVRRAVDSGARLSTHLGNGSHLMLPRHPNYIWAQLSEDRLMASLIVDGHHLPPEVVKTFVRAKTPPRCILVSDMSGMAGLRPGRYQTGLCDLEILPDGRLVVAGQRDILAGASRPLGTGIANAMRFADIDLPTAIAMATTHPAELLGLPPIGLEPGMPANLVQFNVPGSLQQSDFDGATILAAIADGQVVHGTPWQPA